MYFDYYNLVDFLNDSAFKFRLKKNHFVHGSESIIKTHSVLIKTIKKEYEAKLENNVPFELSKCIAKLINELLLWKTINTKYDNCLMSLSAKSVKTREKALMVLIWFISDRTGLEYDNYKFSDTDIHNKLYILKGVFHSLYMMDSVLINLFNEFYQMVNTQLLDFTKTYDSMRVIRSYNWRVSEDKYKKQLPCIFNHNQHTTLMSKYSLSFDQVYRLTFEKLFNLLEIDFDNYTEESVRDKLVTLFGGPPKLSLHDIFMPAIKEIEQTMDRQLLIQEFEMKPMNVNEQFDKIFDSMYELNMTKSALKTC